MAVEGLLLVNEICVFLRTTATNEWKYFHGRERRQFLRVYIGTEAR